MSARADAHIDWVDITGAVLLALATVATAWSGYQASRWNGEQAKAAARANAARIESARAAGLANAQTQVDVATFIAWVDAYAHDDARLTAFYSDRFRAEFKPAVDAWVATKPLKNRHAPLTPFAMPQYRLAEQTRSNLLQKDAEQGAAQARAYIQRSTNYVLGVVLFAAALFFAGMSAKLSTPRLRVAMLSLGCLMFVGTLAWVATFPVSVAV